MSLAQTRFAIEQFLAQPGHHVLAVRGEWGVGKTYLWRQIIKERGSTSHHKKYAYVSLFGVENLTNLNEKIFQMTVGMEDATTPPTVESAAGNIATMYSAAKRSIKRSRFAKFIKGSRKATVVAKDIVSLIPLPAINRASNLIATLTTLAVRDTLICLDDIERLGKGLRIEDVFGLVSELKETRNCSVVLLLNDDAFPPDIGKGYADFRDKVIDMEVAFVPTSQDCVNLVLASDYPYYGYINEYVKSLGITNIRIIKRCTELLSGLADLLKGREKAVIEESVKSIVLFCWCWFHRREGVPTLESVIAAGKDPYTYLLKKREDMGEEEITLRQVMNSYGYRMHSSIGEPLAEYVRRGYYNDEVLRDALDDRDAEAQRDRSGTSFHSVFEKFYYGQFGNNEEEFIHAIYELIENHGRNLNGFNLDQAISFVRKLGRDTEANDMVEKFIRVNQHRPFVFNVSAYRSGTSLNDPYILRRFNEVFVEPTDSRPVFDVVLEIAKSSSWNQEDVELISHQSVDDWYKLFHSTKHPNLYHVVSWLVRWGKDIGGQPEGKEVSTNVLSALRRIASESKIDCLRITSLGIDLDDSTTLGEENSASM